MPGSSEAPNDPHAPRVHPCTSHAHTWAPVVLVAFVLVIGAAAPAMGQDAAAAPGEDPIVLSNQHVGMSAAEIEAGANASEAPNTVAPAEKTPLEVQADALAEIAAAKAADADRLAAMAEHASRALAAVEAGLIPGVGPNEDGPASYERCMEATIRRGESLRSSDALCRFVFPAAAK